MYKKKILVVIILIISLLTSCSSNPLDIKLNNKETVIDFINVDQELMSQSKEHIKEKINELDNKLGDLFIYELSHNIQQNLDDENYAMVYEFYNSEYIQEIEKEKENLTSIISDHEERIKKAFQHFSYYFGDTLLPEHIFYINKLFTQVTCSDKNIAVGLESYISPNSQIMESIPRDQFYQWQRDRMDIKYLERDILLSWIQVQLFNEIDGNLAEHFIQAGKILYILNAMFPKQSEAYILRYSDEDYDWAIQNEEAVWNYLVAERMLFKTDESVRTNFLNEGPKTVGLADDAPDRIGQYFGYKIVKGYMLKNKGLSLSELLTIKYNNILQTYEID